MTAAWSPDELERIGTAEELQITTSRADGTLRREVPIWVVRASGQVYVRTWYRRDNGWFGHVVTRDERASASRAWRSMSPSRTSATARRSCARASMPPTAPSTAATAKRLLIAW
jgi:hypothetical protein